MKRNAILILSLLVTFASWAGPRSWQQAKAIAQQQAAQIGITLSESSILRAKANGQAAQTDAAYYVFANDKDKGYVIVSGDDQMPDIVGYSATGTYSADHLPPAFAAMLQDYDSLVKAVQSGDQQALRAVEEAKALRAEKTSVTVEPLLGDIQWDQEMPYNNKCPLLSKDSTTLTGCVATAMAQVMAYYKYPNQLMAEIPAYTTKTRKIQMPTIPKGETFDWGNIIPQYVKGSYTAEQADAVATLMLACGCAVEMNYNYNVSGADVYPAHLTEYFGYDKELVQKLYRDGFTLKQWTDIIDQELQAKRPILYGGYDSVGGHEFVCDGADGKGLYHINWGWGGYGDNFFDIAILNYTKPDNPIEDGDGFTRNCDMIIGITPDNGVVDEPLVDAVQIFATNYVENSLTWTKSKRSNEKEQFEAVMKASFCNYSTEDFTGYFAVGVKNADGTYDILCKSDKDTTLIPNNYETYNMSFSYAFPVGSTELYYLCCTNGKTWKPCGTTYFMPYLLTATETEIKTETSPLAIDFSLEADKQLVENQSATGTFKITNYLNEEFNGFIGLRMQSNKTDSQPYDVGALYVSIPAGGTITKKTTIVAGEAGDATLIATSVAKVICEWNCTITDGSTAISAPVSTAQSASSAIGAIGGKGCITIKAAEAKTIAVYNANGQKAAEINLKGGEQQTISLQPGVYIVDKAKVVVR